MNKNLYDLQEYNRHKINELLNSYGDSIRQDPHLRQILDAISLIVSTYQNEEQQLSHSMMHNLLYNSSNNYGIHPEMAVRTLSGSKSTVIPNNTLLYAQHFLTSKYTTYFYNIKIQQVYHQNRSLTIKLNLLDSQTNNYNIKFFTNHHVLKGLFNITPQIKCTIQQGNNDIEGTATIDYYDWVDLAYNYQNLQSFSIQFSLEEYSKNQDILIILKLQEPLTLPYIPLNINQIILENRFLWISDNIEIKGPNEYTIRVPEEYTILNIQKLIIDEQTIPDVSQDINGWYVIVQNNKITLHINENYTGTGVLSAEIANKNFLINSPYFVEENNCTVSGDSVCSRFFRIKQTESLFWFHSLTKDKNSIQYLLQILKLYYNCSRYIFNIVKEEPVIVPSNYQGAVPIVKYIIDIESNCPYINLLYSISFYFKHKYEIKWIYKHNTVLHDTSKIIEVL